MILLVISFIFLGSLRQKTLGIYVEKLFYGYGLWVGAQPRYALVFPCLIALVLSVGFFNIKEFGDVKKQYIPTDAKSSSELQTLLNYLDSSDIHFFDIIISRKDFLSVIEDADSFRDVIQVITEIESNTAVFIGEDNYTVIDVLDIFDGKLYRTGSEFIRVFEKLRFGNDSSKQLQSVRLTWPIANVLGTRAFVPLSFSGVETFSDNKTIKSAVAARVRYLLADPKNATHKLHGRLKEVTLRIGEKLEELQKQISHNLTSSVSLKIFYPGLLDKSVRENRRETLPKFLISLLMLILFTVASNSSTVTGGIGQTWVSLAGIVSVLLALLSAFGLLFLLGHTINGVVLVVPFLVVAIGVDDMFILLASWAATSPNLPVPQRLAETLKDAGVSVSFTSLTDAVAFGIGAVSTTPAVFSFGLFTATAILFDFFFQLTFFVAILAYRGYGEKSIPADKIIFQEKMITASLSTDVLFKPFSKLLIITILVVHLVISTLGCTRISANLTLLKLITDRSEVRDFLKFQDQHIFKGGDMAVVTVNNPIDLTNGPALGCLLSCVEQLEKSQLSTGPDGTFFWLRDFTKYFSRVNLDIFNVNKVLTRWLNVTDAYNEQIHFDVGKANVISTTFYTGFTGTNSWGDRGRLASYWRSVARSACGRFNVSIFHPDNIFVDEIASLPPNTMLTTGVSLITMAMLARFFISDLRQIFWMCFCMISTLSGVIGYLALWGADLDPITMVAITMSVGFSVDLTGHVAFKYSTVRRFCADSQSCAIETVATLAWPSLQATVSTSLGVFALIWVQSYMARVFLVTMVLVSGLNLFHGLVVFPLLIICEREGEDQSGLNSVESEYQLISIEPD